jgi:4-hydroxy-2-oxoheptanedioate aldolase
MRKSKALSRLRAGETIRTAALGHYIPGYIFHAARSGYDCIWVDMEHRAFTVHEIQAMLAYSHLFDIDLMLRPPTLEKTKLYRLFEDGAAGLLIPHVSTVEMATNLVAATKFPPLGNRGIDNAGLDADFGQHPVETYTAWANRETFLAVQIETPEAVRAVDAIAAVKGVDLLFIGPGDLGARLQLEGGMTLDEAWERVAAAAQKHGKAFGGPTASRAERQRRRDQGAQLLIVNSEFESWRSALTMNMGEFERLDAGSA